MANVTATHDTEHPLGAHRADLSAYTLALGRVLFSAIFILAAPRHFMASTIAYAASQGVWLAPVAVPVAGLLALAGGLSVLFGYRTQLGAWLLVLFLVPVTLTMHAFWRVTDPTMAGVQQVMFMKNASILGAALIIGYFGAGPISFDARRRR